MSRGNYLGLEDTRQQDRQGNETRQRLCGEHASTGNKQVFDARLSSCYG